MEKPENAHYRDWVAQGHLIETPGNMIALRQIEESYRGCERHVSGDVMVEGTLYRERCYKQIRM